ncbi:MAG: hypothetical protein PVF83_02860 [Anaerolineales bacterium]|jgi:hypothetical protein
MENRFNLRAPIATIVAILFGWVILLSYIVPMESLENLQKDILSWVVIVSAAALLIGVINLFTVHIGKIRRGESGGAYSLSLITAMVITFAFTLLQGPEGSIPQWVFTYIQIPVESSLMAVMAVTLTYASARLLTRRTNVFSVIFLIALLVTLFTINPILGIQETLTRVLANAGARGILLGVSLGTIATGLRILIGSDRPYGG